MKPIGTLINESAFPLFLRSNLGLMKVLTTAQRTRSAPSCCDAVNNETGGAATDDVFI